MTGATIGYVRVSTWDQNPDRQVEEIKADRLFTDHASGKDTNRPQLQQLLDFVRDGDTVIVHSMDRLARNLDDLRRLVSDLTDRGVTIEFIKEKLTFTNQETSPIAKLLLSVMGAVSEFERSLLRERQRQGIEIAKSKGKYKGRKPSLTPEQIAEVRQKVEEGVTKTHVAKQYGISRETVYQYLRASEERDREMNAEYPSRLATDRTSQTSSKAY